MGSSEALDTSESQPIRPAVTASQSWVNIVQSKKSLTKYYLQVSMKDCIGSVKVPEEVFKDSSPLWEDFLIGNFLATSPHVAKIHVIVNKI